MGAMIAAASSRARVGVLVSGRGSNLQALLDAAEGPDFPASVVRVISNIPDVYALDRARTAGVPTTVIPHQDFPSREDFDAALDACLREAGVEFVCLAGFMRVLSAGFIRGWQDRIINIHPSLLPSFKGLHTHRQALDAGVRVHGCTVHIVRPALDDGPILMQAAVPVLSADTPDTLASRVLEQEHRIYPEALRRLVQGRFVIDGAKAQSVAGDTAEGPRQALVSPPLL
ncbi:phosphoribosylglycinamide formyltransferase [Haematospirillum jordaniae]|nr:phosphoribosylglycinamide formyltransferase [Haematospirillum jordaniae]NKD86462.1 phosphoribosylglycinamide formyltransferase [Haematospirillum jordaniae]